MIGLKKMLIMQMVQAIPPVYMEQFCNSHSNAIAQQIPEIFTKLFTNYSTVSEDEFEDALHKLLKKIFYISELLITMFNEVKDIIKLITVAQLTITNNQIVNLGVNIICNMKNFEKGLTNWYEKPKADSICRNFKTHFLDTQDVKA